MRLSRYLIKHGLTEAEFARRAKVAPSTVWRVVRGQMIPRAELRRQLAAATGGEVSEGDLLLDGAGIPEEGPRVAPAVAA